LKCLQDLAIYLGTIAKSWECVTLHGIFPSFGVRTLSNQNQSCMNNNHKERRKMRKNKRWDSACMHLFFFLIKTVIIFCIWIYLFIHHLYI
jgi:hypothetical protein